MNIDTSTCNTGTGNLISLIGRLQREQELYSQKILGSQGLSQSNSFVNPIESYLALKRQAADDLRLQEKLIYQSLLSNRLQGTVGNGHCDLSSLLSGSENIAAIPSLQTAILTGSGVGTGNIPSFSRSRLNSNFEEGNSPFINKQAESETISSVIGPQKNLSLSQNFAKIYKPDPLKTLLGQANELSQGLSYSSALAYPPLGDFISANIPLTGSIGNHMTQVNLTNSVKKKKTTRHPRPKKPKDMPKRPLSAYNIFFKEERECILASIPMPSKSSWNKNKSKKAKGDKSGDIYLKTNTGTKHGGKKPHGKIGFENLAKVIGQRWQNLPPSSVERFKALALEDMKRYKIEMQEYNERKAKKQEESVDCDVIDAEGTSQLGVNPLKSAQQQEPLPDNVFSRAKPIVREGTSAPLKKRMH